jgi:dTDP-4-amino-4,6-dideoxygalactose transaminase
MKEIKKNKGTKYIPLSVPDIDTREIKKVIECIKSGWLITGGLNFKFENLLKEYLDVREVVCLDSCTSALHLSLLALGVGQGDEVITTPFTFASTANVIVHCGARPIFCDIDKDTYNIDAGLIEKKITKKTKVIIPVHYAGRPCDLKLIYKIADKYGIDVIEDAAHAIGSAIDSKKIGSFPGITCFSFYATKNITTGEGGCVASNNKKIMDKIRILKFHGINKDAWKRHKRANRWKYDIVEAGYKNNMTDILASIGIEQIKKIEIFLAKRKKIADRYKMALKDLPGFKIPFVQPHIKHSWHLYPCLIDRKKFGITRNQFIIFMDRLNIGTGVHYIPLHLHSYYRKKYGYKIGQFPIAEDIGRRIVSIPIYTKMKKTDVERVIWAIKNIKKGVKYGCNR